MKKPILCHLIEQLIHTPNPSHLPAIRSATEDTFKHVCFKAAAHSSAVRRRNYIGNHTSVLVRHADNLYIEWRFQKSLALARALILLLLLIERLNELLPGTYQKLMLPQVSLHRACNKHRNSRERLHASLAIHGISDELIELALLPLGLLMNKEPMAYKRFGYIMQHLRTLTELNLAGESPERLNDLLCEKLISINYNNLQFIDYCVAAYKNSLAKLQDVQQKQRILRLYKKELTNTIVNTFLSYDSRFVSVKQGLLNWLSEEQKWLRNKGSML